MSVKAMTWAFDQPLSGSEKVVLLCLADHANDEGQCWPSMANIAKKACITRRSAQRIVGKLQEAGLISFQEQHTDTGRDTSNLYRLEMGGRKIDALDTGVRVEGDTHVAHEGDTGVRVLYEPSERTIRKNRHTPYSPPRGTAIAEVPKDELEAVRLFNELASEKNLSKVQNLNPQRKAKLSARLRECGGLAGWEAALAKVRASAGLCGANDRGWRVDFDFLLSPQKFTKIMEGGYDHWTSSKPKSDIRQRTDEAFDRMFENLGIPGERV